MLNQLLDFGQVEQACHLETEPIDLVRLVRRAIEPWAALPPTSVLGSPTVNR